MECVPFTRTPYFALSLQVQKTYNKFTVSKMHELIAKSHPEIVRVNRHNITVRSLSREDAKIFVGKFSPLWVTLTQLPANLKNGILSRNPPSLFLMSHFEFARTNERPKGFPYVIFNYQPFLIINQALQSRLIKFLICLYV